MLSDLTAAGGSHDMFHHGGRDEMAEGVGEGFGEGCCGLGENMRLKIVGRGVVVVRDGEDRVVCKEV